MKIGTLARPGLMVLGVAGIAATALLGFAAGMAVARDPEAVRRTARRAAAAAAVGLERATLLAAQAREHLGDLWAEAREAAIVDVDDADFKRAATGTSKAPRAAAAVNAAVDPDTAPRAQPARKRATPARKTRAPKSNSSEPAGSESADPA